MRTRQLLINPFETSHHSVNSTFRKTKDEALGTAVAVGILGYPPPLPHGTEDNTCTLIGTMKPYYTTHSHIQSSVCNYHELGGGGGGGAGKGLGDWVTCGSVMQVDRGYRHNAYLGLRLVIVTPIRQI